MIAAVAPASGWISILINASPVRVRVRRSMYVRMYVCMIDEAGVPSALPPNARRRTRQKAPVNDLLRSQHLPGLDPDL